MKKSKEKKNEIDSRDIESAVEKVIEEHPVLWKNCWPKRFHKYLGL